MSRFTELNAINVNDKTEKKNGLTYLSWSYAWSKFKETYPDATYKIHYFDGVPYHYDENLGYMVMTEVTADGETLPMWLPIMDNTNKAMKSQPYEVKTKYKTTVVNAATMFDINTAIMRCLVKNIAMFGLGIYIYAGEDLPQTDEQPEEKPENESKSEDIMDLIKDADNEEDLRNIYRAYKKQIASNGLLLGMLEEKGKLLKGVA